MSVPRSAPPPETGTQAGLPPRPHRRIMYEASPSFHFLVRVSGDLTAGADVTPADRFLVLDHHVGLASISEESSSSLDLRKSVTVDPEFRGRHRDGIMLAVPSSTMLASSTSADLVVICPVEQDAGVGSRILRRQECRRLGPAITGGRGDSRPSPPIQTASTPRPTTATASRTPAELSTFA